MNPITPVIPEAPPTQGSPQSETPAPILYVCPYCGGATPDQPRCVTCRGFLDPLSRQASQNAMGAWFVRNDDSPHHAGCSYDTILTLVKRGRVTLESVLRGPTTHQFWMPAKRVPGVSHFLGICHSCGGHSEPDDEQCQSCGVSYLIQVDRQHLGLMPVRAVPGQNLLAPDQAVSAGNPAETDATLQYAQRRLAVLQRQGRQLWGWVAVLALGLGVVIAAVSAGFASGWLTVRSERQTSHRAGPVEPVPTPAEVPLSPVAAPRNQVPPDAATKTEQNTHIKPETMVQTEFERLILADTEASLREATAKLEAQSSRSAEEEDLLAKARARLAQFQLRGVR
jgi:hypothetical protein